MDCPAVAVIRTAFVWTWTRWALSFVVPANESAYVARRYAPATPPTDMLTDDLNRPGCVIVLFCSGGASIELMPYYRTSRFDFGSTAHWNDARDLSYAILRHHLRPAKGERLPRIMVNEFTRLIVKWLPANGWMLSSEAVEAWLIGFRRRQGC